MLISTVWRLSTRVSAIAMNRSAGWRRPINNTLPAWFLWLLTHSGMGCAPTRATPTCCAGSDCRSETLIRSVCPCRCHRDWGENRGCCSVAERAGVEGKRLTCRGVSTPMLNFFRKRIEAICHGRRRFITGIAAAGVGSLASPFASGLLSAQTQAAPTRSLIDVHHHFVPPFYLAENRDRIVAAGGGRI